MESVKAEAVAIFNSFKRIKCKDLADLENKRQLQGSVFVWIPLPENWMKPNVGAATNAVII